MSMIKVKVKSGSMCLLFLSETRLEKIYMDTFPLITQLELRDTLIHLYLWSKLKSSAIEENDTSAYFHIDSF